MNECRPLVSLDASYLRGAPVAVLRERGFRLYTTPFTLQELWARAMRDNARVEFDRRIATLRLA